MPLLPLASLALSQFAEGFAGKFGSALGAEAGRRLGRAVRQSVEERIADPSRRLVAHLEDANRRAWRALRIALEGESLWGRLDAADDRALRDQIRSYAASLAPSPGTTDAQFRAACLAELRSPDMADVVGGAIDPGELRTVTSRWADFGDPAGRLAEQRQWHGELADDLRRRGKPALARLLGEAAPTSGDNDGPPSAGNVVVVAARYFFRRAVEKDDELFRSLASAKLDEVGLSHERIESALREARANTSAAEAGLVGLADAFDRHAARLESALGEVKVLVAKTHEAVLDLADQMEGQSDQLRQVGEAVQKLLDQHQMGRRPVRPGDSLSIRNDGERQLVKQLVARYRTLPEADRHQVPALLDAVGKLEVVAGDFEAAQADFKQVAVLVADNGLKAEGHHNAFQMALERRDWAGALQEFVSAVRLDPRRFAPFPLNKFAVRRILGAGGFGVAFLCRHKQMNAEVVVKTLRLDDLGRDAEAVFGEAQALRQINHPNVVKLSDCGWADAGKARPYLVMDYAPGVTLEEHVRTHGPVGAESAVPLARQIASGLAAAHAKGILHRDVKPANVLVSREGAEWHVTVIDFGLATAHKVRQASMEASTGRGGRTLLGGSLAGTLDYGAPEQMGKRSEPVGPYSDVFGWAKTVGFALFQTTQPTLRHWQSVPPKLAELLGRCLEEDPKARPKDFAEVMASLDRLSTPVASSATLPLAARVVRPATSVAVEVPDDDGEADVPEERPAIRRTKPSRRRTGPGRLPLLLGGVLAAVLTLGLVAWQTVRVKTSVGTVVVEVSEPGAEVFVDGEKVAVSSPAAGEPIRVQADAGTKQLRVTKGGFETVTTQFTVKAGGTEVVRVRLEPVRVAGAGAPESTTAAPVVSPTSAPAPPGRVLGSEDKAAGPAAESLSELHRMQCHSNAVVFGVAVSQDGRQVLSGGTDGRLRLWDVQSGQELRNFRNEGCWSFTTLSYSPDGRLAVTGNWDGSVRLWRPSDCREEKCLSPPPSPWDWQICTCASFSADGTTIATTTLNKSIRLWDSGSGRLVRTLLPARCGARAVALTKDGGRVVVGGGGAFGDKNQQSKTCEDYDVCVQATVGGAQKVMAGHTAPVTGIAILPGDRQAISSSSDNSIILWDIEGGRAVRRFLGHTGGVNSVAVTPDGRYAVSGSQDNTVRLWRVSTGEQISVYKGHRGEVMSVGVSGDGKIVAAGGRDDTVSVLRLASPEPAGVEQQSGLDARRAAPAPDAARPQATPDRSVAEWVLREGGTVVAALQGPGGESRVEWKNPGEIADGPFAVVGVSLNDNNRVTGNSLAPLAKLARLEELNLWGSSFGDGDVGPVADLRTLRRLSVGTTKLTAKGLAFVGSLGNLTELNVAGLPVDAKAVRAIGRLDKLVVLLAGGCQIPNADFAYLTGLGRLETLGVVDNALVTDRALVHLAKLKSLRAIKARGTKLTEQAVRQVLPDCKVER